MHRTLIQVRYGDTDALGHVNNAVFASYAEVARMDFFREHVGMYTTAGETGGSIMARLAMDFRSQVRLGQKVEAVTSLAHLGNTSLTMKQQVFADDVLAADIEAVIVHFDYANERPVPVPEELRVLAEKLLDSR